MRAKLAIAGVCLLFGLCAHASLSPRPKNPYPPRPLVVRTFTPPANYAGWYESAEKCAGMKGDFKAVTWTITPTPWGDTTYAEWHVVRDSLGFPKRVEITISVGLWLDSMIVIHESLHDILWRNGWAAPDAPEGLGHDATARLYHPSPPYGVCAPIFYPWHK